MAEDEKIELDEESDLSDETKTEDSEPNDDDLNIDELALNIEDEILDVEDEIPPNPPLEKGGRGDSSEDEGVDLLDLEEDFSLDDEVIGDTTSEYENIDLLLDISLDLVVELGRLSKRIGDVLKMKQGSVLELSRAAGEPVDVYINDRLIAKGEVVVHEDDNLGIKIIHILNPAERLRSLRS